MRLITNYYIAKRVPERLQKAMAAEAEAAREARAKVIAAEGEHKVTTNNNKCENVNINAQPSLYLGKSSSKACSGYYH